MKAEKYVGRLEQGEFHGYWENGSNVNVTPIDQNVVCSYYVNRNDKSKIIIIISNRTKKTQEIMLRFEPGIFGKLAGKIFYSVSDNAEEIVDSENNVKLSICPEDFICAIILGPGFKR